MQKAIIAIALAVLDTLKKLVGAFDPDVAQVSRSSLVIVFGEGTEEYNELKVMVPVEMAENDPEFIKRSVALISWAIVKPDHYWTSTQIGIDAVEEASKCISTMRQ